MKILRFIFFALILLAESCVERTDVPIVESKPTLVVDGAITDTAGKHTVKLFLSTKLNDENDIPEKVTGASVKIIEDGTTELNLTEASPGVYETDEAFAGMIGKTYKLSVTTEEGKVYESIPTDMKPAGTLHRVYAEYRKNVINPQKPDQPQDAFYIFADGSGTGVRPELLRWRWKAVYQVNSTPEKRIRRERGNVVVPDPPVCSGWQMDEDGNLIKSGVCGCCECWVTRYGSSVSISDPTIHKGGNFSAVYLGIIPVESILFHNKLVIEGEQLSISEDVYNFWRLLKIQQEGAESIFQPNVVKIRGNILSKSDPSEEVFGVFSVSASSIQRTEIFYREVSDYLPEPEIVNDDCRIVSGGSLDKPAFY